MNSIYQDDNMRAEINKQIHRLVLTRRRVFRSDIDRMLADAGIAFSNYYPPIRYVYCRCGKGLFHNRNDHGNPFPQIEWVKENED